jgi:hypothetical protein
MYLYVRAEVKCRLDGASMSQALSGVLPSCGNQPTALLDATIMTQMPTIGQTIGVRTMHINLIGQPAVSSRAVQLASSEHGQLLIPTVYTVATGHMDIHASCCVKIHQWYNKHTTCNSTYHITLLLRTSLGPELRQTHSNRMKEQGKAVPANSTCINSIQMTHPKGKKAACQRPPCAY